MVLSHSIETKKSGRKDRHFWIAQQVHGLACVYVFLYTQENNLFDWKACNTIFMQIQSARLTKDLYMEYTTICVNQTLTSHCLLWGEQNNASVTQSKKITYYLQCMHGACALRTRVSTASFTTKY